MEQHEGRLIVGVLGAALVMLGLVGLLDVVDIDPVIGVILVAVGIAVIAFDRGAFRRR